MTTLIIIAAILFYFFPSIVALSRSAPNAGSVVILNLFLGWTFIGWVISLAMSFGSTQSTHEVTVNNLTHLPAGYPMPMAMPTRQQYWPPTAGQVLGPQPDHQVSPQNRHQLPDGPQVQQPQYRDMPRQTIAPHQQYQHPDRLQGGGSGAWPSPPNVS